MDFSLDRGVLEVLGVDQTKVCWSIDVNITKLVIGVSCSYKFRCYVVSGFDKEEWSTGGVWF
jgi:hypothetical protein